MKPSKLSLKKIKLELVYSVFVMIAIPSILVVNTVIITRSIQKNTDTELRRKADIVNSVFAKSLSSHLERQDYDAVQSTTEAILKTRPDLSKLEIVIPDNEQWRVIASSDASRVNKNTENVQYSLVKSQRRAVATLVSSQDADGRDIQAWYVVTPIISGDAFLGIVGLEVSTADAQELIDSSLRKAFFILLISIVTVVLLLINHYKFVGYAQLLDKQRELNQLMSDFLSVATHELKAPLTVIKGMVSNIEDGLFGPINLSAMEQLSQVEQQTDRLTLLITDLLNVSRIEQGKITYNIEQVDVSKVMSGIIEFYGDKAKDKNITIHYEPTEGVNTQVYADSGGVQEIFTNLIDNAVKYTIEANDIHITHELSPKGMLVTHVRDGGIGMSPDEQKRLFQRFYRIKNDKTAQINGTGLGLWIIKKYIENMGGNIQVSSMQAAGTVFSVSLPTSEPKKRQATPASSSN